MLFIEVHVPLFDLPKIKANYGSAYFPLNSEIVKIINFGQTKTNLHTTEERLEFFPKHVSSNFISFNKLNEKAALEIVFVRFSKRNMQEKKKKKMMLHHTVNSCKNKDKTLK